MACDPTNMINTVFSHTSRFVTFNKRALHSVPLPPSGRRLGQFGAVKSAENACAPDKPWIAACNRIFSIWFIAAPARTLR